MKKLFLLAGFASLFSASLFATSTQLEESLDSGLDSGSGVECPSGCYGGTLKCCTTRGGSTYFTRA